MENRIFLIYVSLTKLLYFIVNSHLIALSDINAVSIDRIQWSAVFQKLKSKKKTHKGKSYQINNFV